MRQLLLWSCVCLVVTASGCKRPTSSRDGSQNSGRTNGSESAAADNDGTPVGSASDNKGVFGRTTSDIGEFDATAGAKVSDSTIDENRLATPLVGSLAAYGPIVERISKLYIEQAVNLFYAEHGRYPRSYDEFMEKIIRANNIELPVLPGNAKYQYDVENHRLEVVEDK